MYKNIIVATDGSKLSVKAAIQGMDLAKLFNARLSIIYVIDQRAFFFPHEVQELAAENPYFTILDDLRRNAQAVMDSLKKEAAKREVEFEVMIKEGAVVDQIQESVRSSNADLLVLGAHGQT
ncbi:MAG: universal stress protein, partial [Calditrichia bacterium]